MKEETRKTKVQERIEDIRRIKEIRDKGEMICIPFYEKFPRLSKSVPGVVKGINYKISAASGIGKTQLTKQLFVILPLDYARNHPESKLKVKIIYFALEESQEEFIDSLISAVLAMKHKVRIDPAMLKGLREEYIDDNLLALIEDCQEEVDYYMNYIDVVDSTFNPTGLYKRCRSYSEKAGTHVWNEVEFTHTNSEGVVTKTTEKVYSHYEPNDPNEHVIVITDHISLIQGEFDKYKNKMLSQHEAMGKWSTEYCNNQISKHWKWTVVNVQQQGQSNESQQFTNTGKSIVEKTYPTLSGLANNLEIQRDDYVILGLYSPDRYGFEEHMKYDINRFRDTYRCIMVLKNRIGIPNKNIPLLFDGATNRFSELPLPNEKTELERYYLKADELLNRKK